MSVIKRQDGGDVARDQVPPFGAVDRGVQLE